MPVVDRVSTCAPGGSQVSLCSIGEPNSIRTCTAVEPARMNATGPEADDPAARRDGRGHRTSRKQSIAHGQTPKSQGMCRRNANMDIVINN